MAKRKRVHGNAQKKAHLINILKHAINNQETLCSEKDQVMLRKVAVALHCTPAGVRVRYEDCQAVKDFNALTFWKDLLTDKQREMGDQKYDDHAKKAAGYAEHGTKAATHVAAVPAGASEVNPSLPPAGGSEVDTSLLPAGGSGVDTSSPPMTSPKPDNNVMVKSLMEKSCKVDAYDDGAASTVAPSGTSGKSQQTQSGISSGTGTTGVVSSNIDEGSQSEERDADLGEDDINMGDLERFKDNSKYHKLATSGQAWKVEEYSHLYQADPSDPDCITFLPTGKRIHRTEQSQNSHHGHSSSGAYQSSAKVHFFASDLFGPFHLDQVPKNPAVVPSMSTIRQAYGDRLPAYDTVGNCLPLSVHLVSGKKATASQDFTAHKVFGMGVCYWDGSGGPGHFRDGTKVQGNLVANWTVCRDGSDQSVYIETVYEDPYFSSTTKVTTQKYERLIDPADEQKRPDPRGQKEQEHKYNSHLAAEGQFCTVTDGRWWPIWLLCRTKKGWWTICWYQLLECGEWLQAVWWYDDRHVHLLDVIR